MDELAVGDEYGYKVTVKLNKHLILPINLLVVLCRGLRARSYDPTLDFPRVREFTDLAKSLETINLLENHYSFRYRYSFTSVKKGKTSFFNIPWTGQT